MVESSPCSPLAHRLCCADLYQHPLVLAVLGESWHPGGLSLTRALAKEIRLSKDDHLLDLACGRGASCLMLAQVFKCRVTGIDTSADAIEQARKQAHRYRLEGLVTFTKGDASRLPFPSATFSAALCECATSLFADRRTAFGEIARVLQPGGRLALSDMTFAPDKLPAPLDLPLARALCIPLGMGPEAYEVLIEGAGLMMEKKIDCSSTLVELLAKAESFLGTSQVGSLPDQAVGGQLSRAAAALQCARQLIELGELGYWAFMARKA